MSVAPVVRAAVLLALLAAGLAVVRPAAAHRAKMGLTTIAWNERTSSLEVVHRLHVHDARQALRHLADLETSDLETVEARARLALYVEKSFSLGADGPELTLVGAELEGPYVFVYQEAVLEGPPRVLEIRSTMLQDVFKDQANTVNVEAGGSLQTVVFRAGDDSQTVTLSRPDPDN